jgi:polysaccharide biosynthesis/export protein
MFKQLRRYRLSSVLISAISLFLCLSAMLSYGADNPDAISVLMGTPAAAGADASQQSNTRVNPFLSRSNSPINPQDRVSAMQNILKGTSGVSQTRETQDLTYQSVADIPSSFETYAQGNGMDIKQFGYDIFRQIPITFAPVDSIPVGPDYVLGPEDEIRLVLWGKFNADFSLQIDRDGKIVVPNMGVLHIAGLTFEECRAFLEKELSRYFKPSEVKMNVSMGALRTIRVFVVGNIYRPGSYTLSSLSTIINALFASGGPSKFGSMRDIQVKRNGATIVHFDLYDFLLRGDKSKDIRLMPEDVVFVPPVGPLVGISGGVRVPAIYEMKDEKTIKDVIDAAGGFNDIAFKGRLQIDRIVNNNRQTVFESALDGLKPDDINVQPGDLVKIFLIVDDQRIVKLSGAVLREGDYGISDGMTIKDLISLAGGLRYYAFTDEAELTRVDITQNGPVVKKVMLNLKKAVDGDAKENVALQQNDYLFVRSVPEWEIYRTVKIDGQVRFPGTYTITKGELLSSLIERAGGLTEKAYPKGAVFTRESVRELQQRQLEEAVSRLEHQFMAEESQTLQSTLTPEEAIQQRAGMEQRKALIEKLKAVKAKGRIALNLVDYQKFKTSEFNIPLEDGDKLVIPERPVQVQVIGAVYNQNAFVYKPDMAVSDYVDKAGGMTEDANEDELFVLKVDGTAISRRSMGGFLGGTRFMNSRLDPGDTVVVPEKIEKVAWLRNFKDITQVFYQIAVTVGVLVRIL